MRYLRGLNTLGGGSIGLLLLLLLLLHLSLSGGLQQRIFFQSLKELASSQREEGRFFENTATENGGIRPENIEIKCIWKLVFEETKATACFSRFPGATSGFVRVSMAPEGPVRGLFS